MKNSILFYILFSSVIFKINSQHKKIIYVNEAYKITTFLKYKKKLNSKLFDIAIVENDSAIFKKLRYNQYFGKLNKLKKSQLSKLLHKRYKIDSSKVWLIHYIDSIPNIKKMPEESGVEFIDSLGRATGIFLSNKKLKSDYKKHPYTGHMHTQSAKDFIKGIKKEKEKIRNHIELLHFYNFNKGFPTKKLNELKYYEDQQNLISNLFSDKLKKFPVIILHPNGEFYVAQKNNFKKERRMLKKPYFNKKKKKWLNIINKLTK